MKDSRFDIVVRTERFAKEVREFLRDPLLRRYNSEDIQQLTRSSGSVAANCVEANEAIGKGDFLMRMRICRKEAKESLLWLRLLHCQSTQNKEACKKLQAEAKELVLIFNAGIKTFTRHS